MLGRDCHWDAETDAFEVFSEVNVSKRKESCVSEKKDTKKWRSTLIRSLRESACGKTGLTMRRCEEISGLGRAE